MFVGVEVGVRVAVGMGVLVGVKVLVDVFVGEEPVRTVAYNDQ